MYDTDRNNRHPRIDSSQSTLWSLLASRMPRHRKQKWNLKVSRSMYYIVIIGECKIINSSISVNKCPSIGILAVTTSKHMPCGLFSTYQHVCFAAIRWTTDDSAYRNRQHVSMLAYFFFSLYFIVDISHFDRLQLSHEFHIFSLHDNDTNWKMTSRADVFIVARKANRSEFKMLLIVLDNCDVYI